MIMYYMSVNDLISGVIPQQSDKKTLLYFILFYIMTI